MTTGADTLLRYPHTVATMTTAATAVVAAASASSSQGTTASNFYPHVPLLVKRLSEHATLPKRSSELAAGLDLCSSQVLTIPAGERRLVPTDLALCCPPGTYGRIAPRSGLALKKGIDVGAGVIDADYRGPVGIILFNWGSEDFHIEQGDRIAQLILERIVLPMVQECTSELPETVRGVDGFGSTGIADTPLLKKQRTVSPSNVESPNDTSIH